MWVPIMNKHAQDATNLKPLTAMGGRSSVPSEGWAEEVGGMRGKGDW